MQMVNRKTQSKVTLSQGPQLSSRMFNLTRVLCKGHNLFDILHNLDCACLKDWFVTYIMSFFQFLCHWYLYLLQPRQSHVLQTPHPTRLHTYYQPQNGMRHLHFLSRMTSSFSNILIFHIIYFQRRNWLFCYPPSFSAAIQRISYSSQEQKSKYDNRADDPGFLGLWKTRLVVQGMDRYDIRGRTICGNALVDWKVWSFVVHHNVTTIPIIRLINIKWREFTYASCKNARPSVY